MNLHEYQSKELFAQYAIPIPQGRVADSPEAAEAAARGLGGSLWVVKAQVHAGGRGKAGGVKVVKDLEAVRKPPTPWVPRQSQPRFSTQPASKLANFR